MPARSPSREETTSKITGWMKTAKKLTSTEPMGLRSLKGQVRGAQAAEVEAADVGAVVGDVAPDADPVVEVAEINNTPKGCASGAAL